MGLGRDTVQVEHHPGHSDLDGDRSGADRHRPCGGLYLTYRVLGPVWRRRRIRSRLAAFAASRGYEFRAKAGDVHHDVHSAIAGSAWRDTSWYLLRGEQEGLRFEVFFCAHREARIHYRTTFAVVHADRHLPRLSFSGREWGRADDAEAGQTASTLAINPWCSYSTIDRRLVVAAVTPTDLTEPGDIMEVVSAGRTVLEALERSQLRPTE